MAIQVKSAQPIVLSTFNPQNQFSNGASNKFALKTNQDNEKTNKTNKTHMATGCVAGIVSRTITAPLERLRIMQQTGQKPYNNLNIRNGLKYMIKQEGPKSMWKGNGINMMIQAPFTAFEFYFYEVYKNNLYYGKSRSELEFHQKVICGSLTGMSAAMIVYPMDVVKTYTTINNQKRPNVLKITCDIISQHGITGLYKGLSVSLVGIMPLIGIRMASFDALMSRQQKQTHSSNTKSVLFTMACGASAGLLATTICYPSDMLRKMMQLAGSSPKYNYNSVFELSSQIWKSDGFRGFYKGFSATAVKTVPLNAMMFMINEQLKKALQV